MNELLSFLAGASAASVLVYWTMRARRAAAARAAMAEGHAAASASQSPLFHSLARELADIASGVEGNSVLLVESARLSPSRVPAIEGLWLAALRLRRFHDKIRALVEVPRLSLEPHRLPPLLDDLLEELKNSELGLRMATSLPEDLPRVTTNHGSLLCALSFVCHALRELEPGARCLTIQAEYDFEDEAPKLEIELQLEYDEDPGRSPDLAPPEAAFHLARTAAENLLHGMRATVEFDRDPGHNARALVALPTEPEPVERSCAAPEVGPEIPPPAAIAAPAEPRHAARQHQYGGVLVLEHDPAVRSMVASELKASGRAVFACADGAAARSLLQATPNRFEMLVVDQASRLGPADALASTATKLCPELKVFVLSDCEARELPPEIAPRVRCLRKPFGMHELRRALTAALENGV